MDTYDFIIIGGGIAGASAAYALAPHGRVALVERENQPGYHATSRSAAMLIVGYGSPAWRRLNMASRAFLENPPDGFSENALIAPRGYIAIARPDQSDQLRERYDAVVGQGIPAEFIEGRRILELSPTVRPDLWSAAIYDPAAADIDVDALLQGYLRGARTNGAEMFYGNGVGKISKPSEWHVTLGDRTICAPIVLNAAGAWADETARLAGLPARGLTPYRRTAITFDPPEDTADSRHWATTGDLDETFYFRPQSGKIMASPADVTPSPPCDSQPEEIDIAIVADRVQNATTMTIPRIAHSWSGLRTFAPDKEPVIGPDPVDPSFIWVAGQGGTGIISSPAASTIAAACATGEALPASYAPFNIDLAELAPGRLKAQP